MTHMFMWWTLVMDPLTKVLEVNEDRDDRDESTHWRSPRERQAERANPATVCVHPVNN